MLNELLGFVVLTGPLFLIVLWVPVCIGLGIWVGRKVIKKGMPIRIAGGVLVFLLTLFLPVTDLIADRMYLNYLCETQAGYEVYQTVELPAEYWDEQGRPRFLTENGGFNTAIFDTRFEWLFVDEPHVDVFIKIEKRRIQLFDNETNEVLGEKIRFQSFGGWVEDFSPAPGRGGHCDQGLILNEYGRNVYSQKAILERKSFMFKIFKRVNSSAKEGEL